jgi:glycosyltransferase involved in cell wall biosynthesis
MARIVYMSSSVIPSRAANSVHVMHMCHAFSRNGHEVDLVAGQPTDNELQHLNAYQFYGIDPNFKLIRLPRGESRIGKLKYWISAARHSRRVPADIIYARDIQSCHLALGSGPKIVLELHELQSITTLPHFRWAFQRIVRSPRFMHLVVVSAALANDVEGIFPELRNRIRVAHDGANPIRSNLTPALLDRSDTGLLVGYVGNLYPGRGMDLIRDIAERLEWTHFHLVGNIGKGLEEVTHRIRQLQNVTLHGHLPFPDAQKLAIACDVLIAPYQEAVMTIGGLNTTRWMSPLKLFEYMASGKAIICSDISVLREILSDGETAIMCPPNDLESWCREITRLRDDPALRRKLGQSALESFLSKYTWDSRAKSVLISP